LSCIAAPLSMVFFMENYIRSRTTLQAILGFALWAPQAATCRTGAKKTVGNELFL